MPDQDRLEMMVEAVHLYYEQGFNQKQISDRLACSISTVSRLLKEAQEEGVVRVVIDYPYATIPSLGRDLKAAYDLLDACVIPTTGGTYADITRTLGHSASVILDKHLRDNMVLGISLGMSVASTVHGYSGPARRNCKVFRLQGAVDSEMLEGANLAQVLADKLDGEAIMVPSPWLLPNETLRDAMLQEQSVRQVLEVARRADVGLVGIGTLEGPYSTILRNNLITIDEINEAQALGAVGEILGQHYDIEGRRVDVEFSRRVIAVELEATREFPVMIGVAAGQHKVEPLIGAIRGGYVNVVVIDEKAALEMLARAG